MSLSNRRPPGKMMMITTRKPDIEKRRTLSGAYVRPTARPRLPPAKSIIKSIDIWQTEKRLQ